MVSIRSQGTISVVSTIRFPSGDELCKFHLRLGSERDKSEIEMRALRVALERAQDFCKSGDNLATISTHTRMRKQLKRWTYISDETAKCQALLSSMNACWIQLTATGDFVPVMSLKLSAKQYDG